MTILKYSIDEFVHDMSGLMEGQPEQDKLFDKGSSYLDKLINSPDAIPEEFRNPSGNSNHGSYRLHYSEDNGLLVTAVVWGPGDHLGPHDHRTWGMIGVLGNEITETRFRRVDDREKGNYAVLEQDRVAVVRPGDVSLLIPEVDEIHQMDNFTDRSTVEIHVYGHDLRGLERAKFDLETGKVSYFTTQKFHNC